MGYLFELPSDFSDYEWEIMEKGYFSGSRMTVAGRQYRLNFYDAVRLGQEIASELENGVVFFEPNLVVVRSVTEAEMERAAGLLVQSGLVASLIPD